MLRPFVFFALSYAVHSAHGFSSLQSVHRPVSLSTWGSNGGADTNDLSKLTVVELKSRLAAVGLKVSGKKGELVLRLLEGGGSPGEPADTQTPTTAGRTAGRTAIAAFKEKIASSLAAKTRKDEATSPKPTNPPALESLPYEYTRAAGDTAEVSPEFEQEILRLLETRRAARRARDFSAADSARDALKLLGVGVDDGLKTWRADWAVLRQAKHVSTHGFQRVASDPAPLPPKAEAAIDELLFMLAVSRSRGDKDDAQIKELRTKFYVELDEPSKEWRVGDATVRDSTGRVGYRGQAGGRGRVEFGKRGHDYARAFDDASMATFPLSKFSVVDGLLSARIQAKFRRDFQEADRCQGELHERLGISLEDDLKEWRADGHVDKWRSRRRGHARDRAPGGPGPDAARGGEGGDGYRFGGGRGRGRDGGTGSGRGGNRGGGGRGGSSRGGRFN